MRVRVKGEGEGWLSLGLPEELQGWEVAACTRVRAATSLEAWGCS